MFRIILILALLAAVQCGGGSESESSESSSETPSETSTCEDTPSEPPPCPCIPLDVGQCCDDCQYCKDENAICVTYGYSKLCVCKTYFIFDEESKKCIPGGPFLNFGFDGATQNQTMQAVGLARLTPKKTDARDTFYWEYFKSDEVAQAYCASNLDFGYALALWQDCDVNGSTEQSCKSICANWNKKFRRVKRSNPYSCFDALNIIKYIYADPTRPDVIESFSYGKWGCNPRAWCSNYCCCVL
ncbi:uncharacterized protein LOC128204118 [Mya arenaria]|uniref:uncharacterized protein LOC128204118 n=1 Tax=Mya arenaria TaxID=6604 RepID=UPI0022E7C00C|nr:uncharacterized protein LOC128204118 [Mya arenaria]